MERNADTLSIRQLRHEFPRIEFPEYQRESTVWTRDQKQRLLDSILRRFDIAAVYFYVRDDEGWECIDGRQRLNALMSFLGDNHADDDNCFPLRSHNEVADDSGDQLRSLDGKTFEQLAPEIQEAFLDYRVTTVFLSGTHAESEVNLQFLRLNLGTLINAGEKLHAMVGVMRDRIFDPDGLGDHPFLAGVGVPTRRFARQLIAAQLMLQVSTRHSADEFARARHFDLQRYLKGHADDEDPHLSEVASTLDALLANAPTLSEKLGNRAITVSVVLAAWELSVTEDVELAVAFGEFIEAFLGRLAEQVARMKEFKPDPRYDYLTTFQRHLTQAAVEKPAISYRHRILLEQFDVWRETGELGHDEPTG
ncbi:MAG: DUF262 domain-containing protein [Actinobacteria bacterium]|nr:DUF262 domain-containing protein [Actinomycetota bacterium]